MKLSLAENIRMFRKQKKMTQEKLAEALGVTVGAVYKWESGLSQPELGMLVELADFFDISVDVLIGYRTKDNRMEAMLERINTYCQVMDPTAISEAEKLLGKYPHSFEAVLNCASVYMAFGTPERDANMLKRALELLEEAKVLLPQNDDPRFNELTILGGQSEVWFLLGDIEKSLEVLKKNNAAGIFSDKIGLYLAVYLDRPEEAKMYLSEALLTSIVTLINVIFAYYFFFKAANDWKSAETITAWGIDMLSRLRKEVKPDITEKILAELQLLLSHAQYKQGRWEEAFESLDKTKVLVQSFDSMPEYSLKTVRFTEQTDQTFVYDVMGKTAADSIATVLGLLDDPAFSERWKEFIENEQ